MSKEIQQKKKALITKLFNEHPEIREAKKFTGIIVLAWFLTRVFAVATEYCSVACDGAFCMDNIPGNQNVGLSAYIGKRYYDNTNIYRTTLFVAFRAVHFIGTYIRGGFYSDSLRSAFSDALSAFK